MDPRIRIRIHPKMSWIRNTAEKAVQVFLLFSMITSQQILKVLYFDQIKPVLWIRSNLFSIRSVLHMQYRTRAPTPQCLLLPASVLPTCTVRTRKVLLYRTYRFHRRTVRYRWVFVLRGMPWLGEDYSKPQVVEGVGGGGGTKKPKKNQKKG